jgi:hypothetical protein
MAAKGNDQDQSVVGRLADRGEEATNRLLEAVGSNLRLTDALTKALNAKGRLDSASKSALAGIGLAPADELRDLRKQLERLEKRITKLEASGPAGKSTAKRSETKTTPSAKRAETRAPTGTAGAEEEKAHSPAPGRAIGGSVSRSSGTGGGAARGG